MTLASKRDLKEPRPLLQNKNWSSKVETSNLLYPVLFLCPEHEKLISVLSWKFNKRKDISPSQGVHKTYC